VQYLYAAAEAWETTDADRWSRYLELAEAVWQGLVGEVIEQLRNELARRQIGPEMTWNDPEGAEAILQLRAAALCEDGRLDDYLRRRPGYPLTRRPALATAT
jgi:hypothetical protein